MSEKKVNKFIITLVLLTFFLTFFGLGAYLSDDIGNLYVNKVIKTDNNSSSVRDNILNRNRNDLDLERFWSVYDLVKSKYYGVDGLSKEDLVDGAISGLIGALGDKHSEFMTAEVTQKFNAALSGDFEGIGAVIQKISMGVEVERVIKGSPAQKVGLIAKDIIIKANGEDLLDLDLYDAVDKIKGPAGTKVMLDIIRQGEPDLLEIEITRAKIKIPSIDSKIFEEENIGYIEINMFGQNTSVDFEKALNELKDTDGLIIDLRNNGGGYLQSAVEILGNFIEEGKILVKTKYRDSFFDVVYRSIGEGERYNKKVVVIINGSSASASEITAGALSDQGKAIIVGEKSYGKGSVQQPFNLEKGSMLKLTIAKWFTPNGKNIDKEGIEPDIEVKFKTEDFEKMYDRQLEESKKILKSFIEIGGLKLTVDKYLKERDSKK